MEALIYDETPLADYLEGDASPSEPTPNTSSPPTLPQYAPKGLPRVRSQLRALRDTARSVANLSDERFLDRFRYIIIASQLLSEDSKPRTRPADDDSSLSMSLSLRGALLTTGLSFFVPWLLHWVRILFRNPARTSWTQICLYPILAFAAALFLIAAFRRQYARFVRQSTALAASKFVSESHKFDTATSAVLRYVQEIEVVARGYHMSVPAAPSLTSRLICRSSNPMPPISRLDEKHAARHCRELRSLVAKSLTTGLTQFVHFHNELQPFVNMDDLNSYYHIYEISTEDFAGAVNFANDMSLDAQESLEQLRFLSSLHAMARKLLLIDLLALRPYRSWSDVYLWRRVMGILQTLLEDNIQATNHLSDALSDENRPEPRIVGGSQHDDMLSSPAPISTSPLRQQPQAQNRRFETVASGVRSLNAKVRIARDDLADLIANDASEATISSTIAKHYENVGSELRNLLVDWERGRSAMSLNAEVEGRASRPSSGVRSPISPSPSLGGVTMVDGGPADALRLLTGDYDSGQATSADGHDEEVFEAVARPRKRLSLAVLTREEKMAKLQEDRKKRATFHEQAETTTNMLRELQMVIKHRPHNRTSSRVTSV
jgi:Mysoin-binding motif of peroxisomes